MDETQTEDLVDPTPTPEWSMAETHVLSAAAAELREGHPAADPAQEVSDPAVVRYDQMAKAASAGLMAHQDVETAIVEISGSSGELVFHLTCTLVVDIDPSAVMELIAHGVIPNVERLLGESFASRDLQFAFAPTVSTTR